jgi:hypothetical protein
VLDTEQMLTLTSPRSTLTNRIWQRTTPVLTGTSSVSGELLPGAVSEQCDTAARHSGNWGDACRGIGSGVMVPALKSERLAPSTPSLGTLGIAVSSGGPLRSGCH